VQSSRTTHGTSGPHFNGDASRGESSTGLGERARNDGLQFGAAERDECASVAARLENDVHARRTVSKRKRRSLGRGSGGKCTFDAPRQRSARGATLHEVGHRPHLAARAWRAAERHDGRLPVAFPRRIG
jgi:hypothetical protein